MMKPARTLLLVLVIASCKRVHPMKHEQARVAHVTALAATILPGMSRADVERIFPNEDGGLQGGSTTRYYEEPEIMVEVPYDETGGAWSKSNHVTGVVRVYRDRQHID